MYVNVCVYPVSRADGLVGGPGAGAEVELLDGETFVIETDAVRPTGRPILDVSQVSVSIDQHVSTAVQQTCPSHSNSKKCCVPINVAFAELCTRSLTAGNTEPGSRNWSRDERYITNRLL